MTARDADDAIAGALADDYVNGTKDGKRHDRLLFIFGDAERYEEFRDAGRALRQRPPVAVRKVPTVAERIAADQRELELERAARGIKPANGEPIHDPAEIDRLLASVGGSVG